MAYKDLLVLLDAEPPARARVELAAALAERFAAHLVGLYVTATPGLPSRFGRFNPDLLEPLYPEIEAKTRERADSAREIFEDITARHSLSAEWRFAIGDPSEVAALHGRYADLIIAGQIDPEDNEALLCRPRPEDVAIAVGRAVLVVPYAGHFARVGERVLVAWDASREATRAVNDALPLLVAARQVTVLSIDPKSGPDGHGDIPGADIALHLTRHGAAATIERTVSGGIGAANALLSRAADLEVDLLVMGAYGHSRVRELLLGGVTRTLLESMTLPVLMSH
jgi:nucleotide-binding universal stress UspA family protein